MLLMASQIETYQQMSALSAAMVEAARAQEWEKLVTLEESVAALRNSLMQDDDPAANLSESERNLKAALIQRILDDDAEVRRHTEPWMEHVRRFLGEGNTRRRVENAYAGGHTFLGGSPR
jgi:flagellar protein FliT